MHHVASKLYAMTSLDSSTCLEIGTIAKSMAKSNEPAGIVWVEFFSDETGGFVPVMYLQF